MKVKVLVDCEIKNEGVDLQSALRELSSGGESFCYAILNKVK